MRRRRLTIHCSSDEEEDDEQQQQQQHHISDSTETLITSNPNPDLNTTHTPADRLPVELSDDDFIDAPENISPPSPPDPIPVLVQPTPFGAAPNSPIDQFLRNLGIHVKREWLDSCISGLHRSVPNFGSLDVARKAELCFAEFLLSDMNFSGGGVLPENVHNLHLVVLRGPFILQVDEIVDIGSPLRDRYKNTSAGLKRCLKLSMTDGVQRVFGMEYRPIKHLEVMATAGMKVAIHNVHIRRGFLLLVPEILDVLGGLVEDLEAARQRLVQEVNKPPRGRRTRTGVVPSLSSRATLAAWPSNTVNGDADVNTSTSQLRSDQGASSGISGVADTRRRTIGDYFVPNVRSNVEFSPSNPVVVAGGGRLDTRGRTAEDISGTAGVDTRGGIRGECSVPNGRSNDESNTPSNPFVGIAGVDTRRRTAPSSNPVFTAAGVDMRGRAENVSGTAGVDTRGAIRGNFSGPNVRSIAESNQLSDPVVGFAGVDTRRRNSEEFSIPNGRPNPEYDPSSDSVANFEEANMIDAMSIHGDDREDVVEAFADPSVRPGATFSTAASDTRGIVEDLFVHNVRCAESDPSSDVVVDFEEADMIDVSMSIRGDGQERTAEAFVDASVRPNAEPNSPFNATSDDVDTDMADEVEHLPILNGDQETPFTYLANLFEKRAAKEDENTPFVQGKIKCFLTGVKEFQFKDTSTYKLQVFVDDGSLISEILIHHDVVEEAIGHSPNEVTAALSSPDRSVMISMRETMKRFQYFLINFEGTMRVELHDSSNIPVALEMNQGCSSSDARSLLTRLTTLISPQTPRRQRSDPVEPVDISP